jgi:F420-dependent oxidoreductase-like protein
LGNFKFGVFLPFYAFQAKTPNAYYSQLKNTVLQCERLGYDSVWLDDHLMYGDWQILEPWTTLSALSSLTKTIRLGTMVTCSAHRNPALLAKTAATLDVLSNGRVEFGIGAGCQENEHTALGFGFPKPQVRVERLGEALEVITRLWTQEKASYQGRHFTLNDAVCEPKPVQNPHPPITVGGSGEKLLKVTAKYADRFDWASLPIGTYKEKLEALEKQCRAVGRDFGEVARSCWPAGQIIVTQDQKEVNRMIAKLKPEGTPLDEYRKGTFAGTPDECIEILQAYADLGVTYFMLFFADLPNTDGLRVFAEEVARKM